jgi:flavin-dependent dehydrogenase
MHTDVLIIGAGPAGLSTALHLVQQDPAWADRLLILEKASHPRHKLCGGGVTRLGLDYLRSLHIPLALPHAVVNDARFTYKNRLIHVRGKPEFLVFHRQEFDHHLAQTARQRGIRIRENEAVSGIEPDPDGVTVITAHGQYRARIVVGADGSRGVTRNTLQRARRPRGAPPRQTTARLLEVVHPAAQPAPQFDQQYALFDFTRMRERLQGYTWDFPARVRGKAHHNRGIYDSRMARRLPKASLPPLLDEALRQLGSDPAAVTIEGHPIHWFSPVNTFSGKRILLAGDAAGAEPLFGEGIAPALGYGKVAAQSIRAAFARQDFSLRDYPWRVLVSQLGGYMLFRWWIAWWAYRLGGQDWYMHTMWTVCGWAAALTRRT